MLAASLQAQACCCNKQNGLPSLAAVRVPLPQHCASINSNKLRQPPSVQQHGAPQTTSSAPPLTPQGRQPWIFTVSSMLPLLQWVPTVKGRGTGSRAHRASSQAASQVPGDCFDNSACNAYAVHELQQDKKARNKTKARAGALAPGLPEHLNAMEPATRWARGLQADRGGRVTDESSVRRAAQRSAGLPERGRGLYALHTSTRPPSRHPGHPYL